MTFQYFFFDTYIGYFLQMLPVVLLAAVVYVVLRRNYLKKQNRAVDKWAEVCGLLLVCWLVGLVALTVVPNNFWNTMWYFLFYHRPSGAYIRMFTFDYNFLPTFVGRFGTENFGNIIMFVPMGILYPLIKKDVDWKGMLGASFALSACIELIQPIMGRSFDVNDLILNTFGAMIGFFLLWVARKIISKLFATKKAVDN